jgi:DNA-binding transcriptional LysR family regulator
MTPRGQLRVYCHISIVRFIAPMVTAYLRDNPEVSIDLRMGDQMIDLLEKASTWRSAPICRPIQA